jgi:hypothetical protein
VRDNIPNANWKELCRAADKKSEKYFDGLLQENVKETPK